MHQKFISTHPIRVCRINNIKIRGLGGCASRQYIGVQIKCDNAYLQKIVFYSQSHNTK